MKRRIASIAITGASGFLGAAVVRSSLMAGIQTHAIVRRATHNPSLVQSSGLTVHELDLRDPTAASRLGEIGADAIIHLAAVVPQRGTDPVAAARETVAAARPVIEAAARSGIRAVLAGSSSEYGRVHGVVREDISCRPVSPYGAAKYAVTELALGMCEAGSLDALVLRPFVVYGPRQGSEMFIAALARSCAADKPFDMTSGEQKRDFVYVDDVATAFIEACAIDAPAARVVNIATGIAVPVRVVAEAIADAFGRRHLLRIGAIPLRADETAEFVGDTARAVAVLGWRPRTSLEEGIARVVADVKATYR